MAKLKGPTKAQLAAQGTEGDPLLRHLTGEYLALPDAMTPEDILYWARTGKKRTFSLEALLKAMDEARHAQTTASFEKLVAEGLLEADPEKTEQYKPKAP